MDGLCGRHSRPYNTGVLSAAEVTDDDCDALYEAGCDDGTVVIRNGVTYVAFDREAEPLEEAIR